MKARNGSAAALIASMLAAGVAGTAQGQNAAQPGDLWQVTSQMVMVGMPMQMPAQTQQVCAPRQWTAPPAGAGPDRTCVNSEFRLTGNTATWKTTCQSPPMTGVGQITRAGTDAYSGSIKYNSPNGEMTVNLTGRRISGCDNPTR